MPGGILELVTNNGLENQWINQNPEVTFFKKIYRRHTPFASELVPIRFGNKLDFGGTATASFVAGGDLVHRLFLVVEIPELVALFPNTKTKDLELLINNTVFTDEEFSEKIRRYIGKDYVEYDQIVNLIEDTLEKYNREEENRIKIIQELEGGSMSRSDFPFLEQDLVDKWIYCKKRYYPIYELVKMLYFSENFMIQNIPLIDTSQFGNIITYAHIFHDLIPHREILMINQVTIHNTILFPPRNLAYLQKIANIYSQLVHKLEDDTDLLSSDVGKIYKLTSMDKFYHFGPIYYDILNSYNAVINVVKTLATTIPIVLAKVFVFGKENVNIYRDKRPSSLKPIYFPTIIDPNFRYKFVNNVNRQAKMGFSGSSNIGTKFLPPDFFDTRDQIYPNEIQNSYLKFFDEEVNASLGWMRNSIDALFEAYREKLFISTDRLFYRNCVPATNIYAYFVPNADLDQDPQKIGNVFNLNIWFFYFFKYLDELDARVLARYVGENVIPNISANGVRMITGIVTLLKFNIEYYMVETSYLLNDLYASCPSANPSDTMKNYIPNSYTKTVSGFNVNKELFGVTLIFHRNHIPSILEMFQYIYYFIDTISPDQVEEYLDIHIGELVPSELERIRGILKLFYYQIFGYFMNIYDHFSFEPPANFGTSEYANDDVRMVQKYVKYFLNGLRDGVEYLDEQFTLAPFISQMEFYFVAEMVAMRGIQKLYYNVLFNRELIRNVVGSTTAELVDLVVQHIIFRDDGFRMEDFQDHPDRVRVYWDHLYQHNVRNHVADRLYYSTFDITRYHGKPYLDTGYQSRYYGKISAPLSDPTNFPSNPYGVDSRFYDHGQVVVDHIPWFGEKTLSIELPIYWNQTNHFSHKPSEEKFQLFPIDPFRIKHNIFFSPGSFRYPEVRFVDEYQLNLLQFVKLGEELVRIYPRMDKYLLSRLFEVTFFLINRICGNGRKWLSTYLEEIGKILDGPGGNFLDKLLVDKCLELGRELFGKLDSEHYTDQDLINCNKFVREIVGDSNINLFDKLTYCRDNFISQYFYYVKHLKSIKRLANCNFQKANMFEIINHFLSETDDIGSLSELIYLYPQNFPEKIERLRVIESKMNDFDRNIFRWIVPFFSNSFPKLTVRDVCDVVNITFLAAQNIYSYAISHGQLEFIIERLKIYQPLLLKKLEIHRKIVKYFFSGENIPSMSEFTKIVGDDKFDKIYSLVERLWGQKDGKELSFRLNELKDVLDHFFLGEPVTFKDKIMEDIFRGECRVRHEMLYRYFSWIDNDYYAFIYFFLKFAFTHRLAPGELANPLISLGWKLDVSNFCSIGNVLEYMMDYLFSCAANISEDNPCLDKLGYKMSFNSIVGNDENAINMAKDVARRGIVLLEQERREILHFRDQVCHILYRNRQAKCAWVRKLGHFLVEEAKVMCGDELLDRYISDWIEVFCEMNGALGKNDGYNKMIGHRDDLISFDEKMKKSYTLVIPFVFYFNQHPSLSIPLNASINVQHRIIVRLRKLEEVAYKEPFSEFVEPETLSPVEPRIKDAYLMAEYIYLSKEERSIFVANRLEYLITELQVEDFELSDNNLVPVYLVDDARTLDCGSRHFTTEVIDSSGLSVRKDYYLVPYKNRSGIVQRMMVGKPSTVNPFIHRKRVEKKNYFSNPAKMMVVLVRPLFHTRPDLRPDDASYFYGERQWDNYGLYPYYDLSKIRDARTNYYNEFRRKINNLDDSDFGFIHIINEILFEYGWNHQEDKFLETLQMIKDKYLSLWRDLFDGTTEILLRDFLFDSGIKFDIWDRSTYCWMLEKICSKLGVSHLVDVMEDYHMTKNMLVETVCSKILGNLTLQSGDDDIQKDSDRCNMSRIGRVVDEIYREYNSLQIRLFVEEIGKVGDLELSSDLVSLVRYYASWYLAFPGRREVANMIKTYGKSLFERRMQMGKKVTFRDVVIQLVPSLSEAMIDLISTRMNKKLCEMIDRRPVELVNYRDNLVINPRINPLISGYLKFNSENIMPENSDGKMWSEIPAYKYLNNSLAVGVNFYSWSLNPFTLQPSGAANLGRIDDFRSVYDLHPLVGNAYPVSIRTMILGINIVRYLSGLCAKAWQPI
ncbi:MAG: major capsid protein [Nitrososphaerota archaeon]